MDKWEEHLKQKLNDFEAAPPRDVWSEIEQHLPAAEPRRRVISPIWRYAAAAVLAIIAVVCATLLLDQQPIEQVLSPNISVAEATTAAPTSAETPATALPAAQPAAVIAQAHSATASEPATPPVMAAKKFAAPTAVTSSNQPMPDSVSGQSTPENASASGEQTNTAEIAESTSRRNIKPLEETSDASNDYALPKIKSGNGGRFSARVYASGMPATSSATGHPGAYLASAPLQSYGSTNGLQQIMTQQQNLYSKEEHHQPITTGVMVRYNLSQRFAIETGLNYSYLSSDISEGSESYNTQRHQHLHYLGLPVNGVVTVWENRRFQVYGSAGAMIQKCVSGNADVEYVVNGKVQSKEREEVEVKNIQASLNAAIGAQVKLCRKVGIYVEPGIGYYFDDNTNVRTIYKEHPVTFNLNVGLRLNFE
ncbi:MAG: outer membrane beta-barrel protein [Muribaculaceae bacterium]